MILINFGQISQPHSKKFAKSFKNLSTFFILAYILSLVSLVPEGVTYVSHLTSIIVHVLKFTFYHTIEEFWLRCVRFTFSSDFIQFSSIMRTQDSPEFVATSIIVYNEHSYSQATWLYEHSTAGGNEFINCKYLVQPTEYQNLATWFYKQSLKHNMGSPMSLQAILKQKISSIKQHKVRNFLEPALGKYLIMLLLHADNVVLS